jgi:hypothetical protein
VRWLGRGRRKGNHNGNNNNNNKNNNAAAGGGSLSLTVKLAVDATNQCELHCTYGAEGLKQSAFLYLYKTT